jgi:hypothetical protein
MPPSRSNGYFGYNIWRVPSLDKFYLKEKSHGDIWKRLFFQEGLITSAIITSVFTLVGCYLGINLAVKADRKE